MDGLRFVVGIATLFTAAMAQEKPLSFDAASVKPAQPSGPQDGRNGGAVLWHEGMGRIHYPAITMRSLLIEAYGVKTFQVEGPGWIDTERYAVDAVMPPATTRDELRVMMQNLLANRFGLSAHRETREQLLYSLTVAKSGSKMKEAPKVPAAPELNGTEPEFDRDGFPNPVLFPNSLGGTLRFRVNGRSRISGQQATLRALAAELTRELNRPVVDDTALPSRYDFVLTFLVAGLNNSLTADRAEAREPVADLFAAIQSQLGLRLEPKRGPVELIVVDHAEKVPNGN